MKKCLILISSILIAMGISAQAQSRIINGHVSNTRSESLPGVKVTENKSGKSVYTNNDGAYKIEVPENVKSLVFSYPGYETIEKTIGKSKTINVVMQEATDKDMNVMVTGMPMREMEESRKMSSAKTCAPTSYAYQAPYQADDFNTESYSTIRETGFRDTKNQPLSTFSIDVDNASYSNVRRFINNGSLPPQDAVRIEEMLNYFKYDFPEPVEGHPFGMHTEYTDCPWAPDHQLLRIGLNAKSLDTRQLPNSNLVFLIDVSGSMNEPNKLPLVKSSLKLLIEELRPSDRIAIVIYAGSYSIALPSTPASKKSEIISVIDNLSAGGSTAGGGALKMAYKVAEENFIKNGNNRIIMATDGDFNVGESSDAAMERLVETHRDKGIYMTVLGFGMGNYKDSRLEIIANKGNGNYSYIDNIQEARKQLVSEFAGTIFTIAKDVKIQIEFNPARIKGYRLIGYENRRLNNEDFNDDTKDAGELGAGHTVTALYEIIPNGSNADIPGIDPLKYQTNNETVKADPSAELMTIKIRFKLPDQNNSIKLDVPVKGKLIAFKDASEDHRFATAVAEFGLILSKSKFKGNASYEHVIQTAINSK
ncbi:MAG: DUF3520 domain-containing protein, partial [Bacteroidales bacterium]|nr:DUF3520 domain-containing protein [Bacteroidales bacterium]